MPVETEEIIGSPGAGGSGHCEMFDEHAGNQMPVLWKGIKTS